MKRKLLFAFSFTATFGMAQTIPNIIDTYIGGAPTKTVIANSSDGVLVPRDLDFHPSKDELWLVLKETENKGGKTVLIKKRGESPWLACFPPISDNNDFY